MRETSPNWFTPSHLHPMPDQCLQTLNRAVVVAQLAEQSFSIPEVCSLNWGIHKKINWTLLTVEKTKIKKKEAGKGLIVYLFDIDGLHLRVLPPWRVNGGCNGLYGGLGLCDRYPISVMDWHIQKLAFSARITDFQAPDIVSSIGRDQWYDGEQQQCLELNYP